MISNLIKTAESLQPCDEGHECACRSLNDGVRLSFDAEEQSQLEELGMETADSVEAAKYPVNMHDLYQTLKVRN